MKVLIVDDEKPNCILLEAMLKEICKCSIAMNGDSAIELFEDALNKKEPFDLVCLDIKMPKKDGYDVLRNMRKLEIAFPETEKKSRIIMVTAFGESNNKVKAFHENCDGYLVKPVERRLLFEMLKKMDLLEETNL